MRNQGILATFVKLWNSTRRRFSHQANAHFLLVTNGAIHHFTTLVSFDMQSSASLLTVSHSGETDEANCSWLHPVWPPPKRPEPDQDNTYCTVSRASTELIVCIHRDFDAGNNVCKPRRLVCECCRDISAWKSRVMKPTVLRDPSRMKPTEYRDEANWFSNWADEANCW